MYNELFESVIRTSGENTNDIDDFNDRDNFWAPIPEKLLFEWVLKEAKQKPNVFGVYDGDELIPNSEPSSNEKTYKKFKNAPAHGSKNPKISRSDSKTGKPFYQDDPDLRVKDDQDIYYNSVKKFEPEEIDKSEEWFIHEVLQDMRISRDLGTRIAFYKETNKEFLEQFSKDLVNVIRKRLGLKPVK